MTVVGGKPVHSSGQEILDSLLPCVAREELPVVPLQPPAISARIEGWRIRPSKDGRGADDFLQVKHTVTAQEFEKILNAPDMDIVDHEQGARFKVRIQIVILEVRERIGMGAVNERKLELFGETELRQGALCWTLHEVDVIGP